LLDDVVLAAAVEELLAGAQHLDDARVAASGEERLLARPVFGFDHGHGLSCPVACDDVEDSRVMREPSTRLKSSRSTRSMVLAQDDDFALEQPVRQPAADSRISGPRFNYAH